MNRRVTGVLSALVLGFTLFGCNRTTANSPDSSAAPSTDADASSKSAASQPRERAPESRSVVIPADTVIQVVNDQALSSKTAQPGDTFPATVEEAIEVKGKTVIPKGARATGLVQDVKAAGRFKGAASLDLVLVSVTINEKEYKIRTSGPTLTHKGKGKRTAVMAGGGAAGGALIGGLAGGGKGALIGGLVGAAAGTGGAAFTGKADVVVPAESGLSFKLLDAVEVRHRE